MNQQIRFVLVAFVCSIFLALLQTNANTKQVNAQSNTIIITEFMAANGSTLADEDGDFSDWIELHNAGTSAVPLAGYMLSDNASMLDKWLLPATTLNADQYLIVFASGKNRAVSGNELHTDFKLSSGGEYLALTRPDGAIATDFAPQYPPLGNDIAYGVDQDGVTGILATPSPGFPNGFAGTMALSISPPSRAFEGSIDITLNSQLSDTVIRYTTDGTIPTSASPVYSGPLTFSNRTTLRAQPFYPNGTTGPIETERYIELQSDVVDFTSDLPLLLIDTFDQTIEQEAQTPVFAQFIDVGPTGQSTINGEPQLATYAGLNIRGALSVAWEKKQYKLETWDENLADVDTSPLGLPAESDWVINGPYADKTLMKNVLVFGWWNEMGRYGSRTRFIEVYLNADDGNISADDYIGVYVLLERIKRDGNRVDIEKLTPADNSLPTVNGGYIWKVDDPNGIDSGHQSSQGNPNCLLYFSVYPRYENATFQQIDAMRGFIDQYEDKLFGNEFSDPLNGYANYIDVDSFIDYGIIQDFTQNTDGYHRSIFLHKPRDGKVTMGPIWDFNFSLGVDNRGLGAPDQPVTDREGGSCWQTTYPRLFEDPEFEVRYWDRWFELRESVFDEAKLMAEIDANAAQLNQAQARNFERWDVLNVDIRDVTLPGTYAGAINILKDWVSDRLEWFDGLWVSPPLFSQEGGVVPAGFELRITRPQNIAGAIYYTLDGSEPREIGGGIAAGALQYSNPISLNNSTRVMARVKVNTGWSALNDDIFNIDTPAATGNLAISEIQYHPHQPTAADIAAGYADADGFEFIELQNSSNGTIDISHVRLTGGITFDFAESDYLVLQPDERVLVVENLDAFAARYGSNLPVAGQYSGKLSNSGEELTVLDQQGDVIEQFQYLSADGWPRRADGQGSSLVRKELATDGNLPNNWRSSSCYGGTPGSAPETDGNQIVINEILAHTDPPLTDAIELYNSSATTVDISNWYLSDSSSNYKKYQIPAGTILGASGFIDFDEGDFNDATNPNNPVPFALSASKGETLYLMEVDSAGNLTRFVDIAEFGATANGESIGRWPNGAKELYPMRSRTLGASNFSNGNSVRAGSIVISEIHYNPVGTDANLEYIELYNAGSSSQSLDNWRLRGEVDYNFPSGTILAAGEAIIVVAFDPADATRADSFRNTWYDFGQINMFGPWTDGGAVGARLNNGGGTIKLQRPDELETPTDGSPPFYPMLEEETVRYDDDAPWAIEPDSGGPALERIDAGIYGDTSINWWPSALDGGTPGVVLQPGISIDSATNRLITTEGGGVATIDISLQSPPRAAVTIQFSVTDDSEGSVSPLDIVFSVADWDQPQRVTIMGVDDQIVDGDTNYTFRINPAVSLDSQYNNRGAADFSVINQDDDVVTPTHTPTHTPTVTHTPTPTYTPRPTNTPVPIATNTPVPIATDVPTNTPVPLPTETVDPNIEFTPTARPSNTSVPIATNTSVPIATNVPTNTPVPLPTATETPVPTETVAPTASNTAIVTTSTVVPTATIERTPTPGATATPTPTPQPGEVTVNAESVDGKVLITWLFTADRQTLWFYLYRSETTDFNRAEPITIDFIPAHFTGTKSYQFEDTTLSKNGIYYYWVEQVFASNNTQIHGPTEPLILGTAAEPRSVYLPFISSNAVE